MDSKQIGCLSNFLWVALALSVAWIITISMANKTYKQQSALIDTGVKTEATIELVKHKGILEWGKVYAQLQYEVDGDKYSNDIPITMRTYKVPGGKVKDGKTVVTAYYDADQPSEVGFEGARDTAKTGRTIAIVMLCICGALTLFLAFALIVAKFT